MDDGTLIREIRARLFDEKGKIWLAPIRHHSPACAAALATMIREIRPSQILIEGPEDYTRLIPDLLHPQTQPPVAIAALVDHKDRPRIAAYFPLCAHSPEFVALKEGQAVLSWHSSTWPQTALARGTHQMCSPIRARSKTRPRLTAATMSGGWPKSLVAVTALNFGTTCSRPE
jgi:hypothetical protein